MSSIQVHWQDGLYFKGVSTSGHSVQLEGSSGNDRGFLPSEMLLVALGGCTGMDIVSLLRKFTTEPTSFEVELDGEKNTDHPKSFHSITAIYHVAGDITPEQALKAVSSSYKKYSVVANSLQAKVHYRIILNGKEIIEK